jgi:hypothetical protein
MVFTLFCYSCFIAPNLPGSEFSESFLQGNSQSFRFNLKNDTTADEALDALNEIQVSGDGGMMLYMTFPNIYHKECKGAVSTFEISRKEFHDALIDVMIKNNRTLTELERSQLAATASLPSELYIVKACGATTESLELNKGEIPPRKGTWIITEIFGVSDLLINW